MSESESLDIDEQGLPEEVADAWATVFLDLWEKDQAAAKQAQANTQPDEREPSCPTT